MIDNIALILNNAKFKIEDPLSQRWEFEYLWYNLGQSCFRYTLRDENGKILHRLKPECGDRLATQFYKALQEANP